MAAVGRKPLLRSGSARDTLKAVSPRPFRSPVRLLASKLLDGQVGARGSRNDFRQRGSGLARSAPVGQPDGKSLERLAREESRVPLLKDFWFFLIREKRWWLTPILVLLLLLGLLMWLSSTAVAPFIYTLF